MKNLFNLTEAQETIARIEKLTPTTQPEWGKMNATQMLAHCNVAYEMHYENIHPRPNAIMRFFIRMFAKPVVVGSKPYGRNGRTAPQFIIGDDRDFEKEKKRLINYIIKTQELGGSYFHNRENMSFGKMTEAEWNTLYSKHLDHHLTQFGV